MPLKLAINISYLFKERPFLERFAAAASAGFKAVEWGSSVPEQHTVQEIVGAREKAGVQVVGLCTPAGISRGEKGYAALPGRKSDFQASLNTAIEYAVAVNCPRIHVLAGLLNDSISVGKAKETFISNISLAADECSKRCMIMFVQHGITVLIEPLIDRNYFLSRQDQAIDLIEKIGRPNVKIEFDTFHAPYLGSGMAEFIRNNLPYIGHIQISQIPDRNEPSDDGTINFSSFFKGIEEAGYDGWVAAEYFATGATEDGLGWAKPYLTNQ